MAKHNFISVLMLHILLTSDVFVLVETEPCQLTCINGGTCVIYEKADGTSPVQEACLCPSNFTGHMCQDVATYMYLESTVYALVEDDEIVTVTVLRDGDLDRVSTVELRTQSWGATSGMDFPQYSEVVTFEPFTYFKNVTVVVTDDVMAEDSEAFVVFLRNPVGGMLIYPETTTVFILDNDANSFQIFPLHQTVRVSESAGVIEVDLLRSGGPNRFINVTVLAIKVADTYNLAPDEDFVFLSNNSLVFEPHQYVLPIRILINNNDNQEGTREFMVRYRVRQDGENIEGSISIIIEDDDSSLFGPQDGAEAATYLFFSHLPYVTSEGQGQVEIIVYRLGNLDVSSEIEVFTSSGTAEAGVDFMSIQQAIIIQPQETSFVLSVPILEDGVTENSREFFYLTMNVLNGGILGRPHEQTVTVTIMPSSTEVTVNIVSPSYLVQEGQGTVDISIARHGRLDNQVSVVVRTEGHTAELSSDFIAIEMVVIFPPMSILEMVEVQIVDDEVQEGMESFYVVLGSVSQGMATDPLRAAIFITDDDGTETTTESSTASPPAPDFMIYIIIAAAAIVAVLVIIAVIVIAYFCCCRSRQGPPPKVDEIPLHKKLSTVRDNSFLKRGSSDPLVRGRVLPQREVDPDTKEYPREKLRFYEEIGSGAFATVFRAEAIGVHRPGLVSTVAVKMLKETASDSDKSDFLKELAVFKMLDPHPNVMSLLGCCTTCEPLYIILEFMPHGNLQEYLRRIRTGKEKDHPGYLDATQRVIQPEEVLKFSSEITRGMEYLASKECIHRDLACRNILLAEDYVCKVSDFGLAREVAGDQQYEMKSKGRVPVRWLAPECLLHNVYTSQSDVWSFGVLMWELVTQGSHPYSGMSSQEVIRQVQNGYRLPKPEHCSLEIYEMMVSCWTSDPEKRPTFQSLRLRIESMLIDAQGYLCMDGFREEDYVYMSPDQASAEEESPL